MRTSTQAAVLDRETDARFWAQTHYRVGHRLDPENPSDRAMMKVWLDIYAKVKREDQAGRLVLTYNHPAVEQHLGDAQLAMQAAAAHLDAAASESDPVRAQQHVEAATVATTTASTANQAAAALQPPTVSPSVVHAAAHEAAHGAAVPPPAPIVEQLPPAHPAVSSIAAQPVLPREIAEAPPAPPAPSNAMPRRHQQLAVAQAVSAPAVAVAVHEEAQARANQGAPPATGSLPAQTIAETRAIAVAVAEQAKGAIVGVLCTPDQRWSWLVFPARPAADDWYGAVTDAAETYLYVAYFDRTDGSWPEPVNEVFGTGRAITVTAHVDAPEPTRSNAPIIAALAGLALVGIAAFSRRPKFIQTNDAEGPR
jgi:hypothetical protein